MATTADIRNGMAMELEGQLYYVVEFQHVKPGKGGAFVRTKLKSVKSGNVIERTFRSGESITEVRLEKYTMQYLYTDGDMFHLMDTQSYEQVALPETMFHEIKGYLKENLELTVLKHDELVLGVEVPMAVTLKVTSSAPGARGDTATNVTKSAVLESGLEVQVPLFINEGDTVKIDTRTGKYLERANA
ncbi:MAG TPA: elongation factor P [Candidatus Edwardsbacteria bacterium]|nr:elongation factor P [Candidatus Edwardsbacteria bacterium]